MWVPNTLSSSHRQSSNLSMKTLLVLASLHLLSIGAAIAQEASLGAAAPAGVGDPIPVAIYVDAARPLGELKPIWRFFGADEPNYAYMKDGQKLIRELGELAPKHVYFRTHNLLVTGDGTPALKWGSTNIYTEDAQGEPVYDWTIVDRIFDTYLAHGVRPLVQLGFMPKALSLNPEPYQHQWKPGLKYGEITTGWAYPPKDYDKWRELIFQWTKHCVDRYGRAEVEQWYWEVWNEPNGSYWRSTPEEFRKLNDYAVDGVRRALPTARVGGPHTAGSGGKFHREFLEHAIRGTNFATGQVGTPLDFIAFHAKGSPTFVGDHVRMGISNQLQAIDGGFAIVASYPETKGKPIILGESDPDGCAACQGPQLGYRNTTMYSSYTAAVFARKYELADKHGVNLEGAVTWAFEFEDQPFFAGFRVLATNGIDLPVMNVFRMFSKMGGRRLPVESDGAVPLASMMKDGVRVKPDISALAAIDGNKLSAMVWHYHDDDIPGPDANVSLTLNGLPPQTPNLRVHQFLIDQDHSNAFTAWKNMGSPAQPTPDQYAQLEKAGQLGEASKPEGVKNEGGSVQLHTQLARQAVSLFTLEWDAPAKTK
jgi:xylan 1,4-beta-xylosidase